MRTHILFGSREQSELRHTYLMHDHFDFIAQVFLSSQGVPGINSRDGINGVDGIPGSHGSLGIPVNMQCILI